jgi:DNA-binding IclR family transcriptional regulator
LAKKLEAIQQPDNVGTETKERGGIQSLERAFAILEEIAGSRTGITLAEMSKRLDLHNSTTFHLVQTMVSLGYVRQMRDSKRYRIGRPLFALAAAAKDEVEMVSLATPILEELSAETGETSHCGVWSGGHVVAIAKTPGAGTFQMVGGVGLMRPAYCTGLGKVLLAYMPAGQLDRYLAATDLKSVSPKTITEPDILRRQLEEIRQGGVAFDDGEFDPEVRCLTVPVRDFTGQVVAAVGISGPMWRLQLQSLSEKSVSVRRAGEELSAALGYRSDAIPA